MNDAFLVHEGVCYRPALEGRNSLLYTPVTQLIQGIAEQFPRRSLSMLRERIYTNYSLTPRCEGMLKVAAKRLSVLTVEQFQSMLPLTNEKTQYLTPNLFFNSERYSGQINKKFGLDEQVQFVLQLKSQATHSLYRYESDRPVGAALFNLENQLLAYGWNTNAKNRTLHAELNLIQSYAVSKAAKFPKHSRLIVSLKPCAMCAAQILEFFDDSYANEILFIEDDPGPFSKNSCLVEGSDLWIKAGSPQVNLRKL